MKCKSNTANAKEWTITNKKGGLMRMAQCATCGGKKSCGGVKGGSHAVKGGDGLFDFLGSDVGGFLNSVGNTAVGIGSQIAVPVLQGALRGKLGMGVRAH